MGFHEIQRNFAGGEITPKQVLRSDIENRYEASVKKMLNIEAESHGPARSRAGFEYILTIPTETYCRLYDIEISLTETYLLVITPTTLYIVNKDGIVTEIVVGVYPYTENDLLLLQSEKVPGSNFLYFVTPRVAPQYLDYSDPDPINWTFNPIGFTHDDAFPPWDPDDVGDSYPRSIAFFEGRMFLGGSPQRPVTVWGSKPGDYTNFEFGTGQPDDAMELPLAKHGTIQWLQSNERLFVGLDTGEHIIYGTGGVIAPDNAQTDQQSAYGSAAIHAKIIEEQVVFIDTQARIARGMQYSDAQGTYSSTNLTFQAEHITHARAREFRYGNSPAGKMYLPLFDGTMAICSIELDQRTLGWYKVETEGEIVSCTVVKELGYDVLWIAVVRDGELFIERTDIEYEIFMDAYKTVTEPVETNVFFGFDHLIGQVVQVVADGAVHPDVLVAGDGSITLQEPIVATTVTAGYGFLAELITLPQMMDTQTGNTLNHLKRYNQIFMYLLDSPRPDVNDQVLYTRSPQTPMDTVEPPETGVVDFFNDTGWDKPAEIKVSQPLPVNLNILALGGKLTDHKI